MNKKIKLISLISAVTILLFLCSVPVMAASDNQITVTKVFHSPTKTYEYKAEKVIERDGKKYELKDTKYKATKESIIKQFKYKGLTEKQVPMEKEFVVNGKNVVLKADSDDIKWTEHKRNPATGNTKFYDRRTRPTISSTKILQVTTDNGVENVTGYLTSIDSVDSSKPFVVEAKFTGAEGVAYMFNGDEISLTDSSPKWQGYEKSIKKYLKLDSSYTLKSGKWTSDYITKKGSTVRYAEFYGTVKTKNYIAYYKEDLTESSPGAITYDAVVKYSNDVQGDAYRIKAIMTYEKQQIDIFKIVTAGVGILILAGLIVAILLYLRKGRRLKDEECN